MACNCTLNVGYTIFSKPVVIFPVQEIAPTGIANGHTYYQFTITFFGIEGRIIWESSQSRWEFQTETSPGVWQTEAYIDPVLYPNLDCPATGDTDPGIWTIVTANFSAFESNITNCAAPCFNKELWIQYVQCAYASWAETFTKNISLGKCVDKMHCTNIVISSLIDVLYRVEACNVGGDNCLTSEEICKVISAIKALTGNCSCS